MTAEYRCLNPRAKELIDPTLNQRSPKIAVLENNIKLVQLYAKGLKSKSLQDAARFTLHNLTEQLEVLKAQRGEHGDKRAAA